MRAACYESGNYDDKFDNSEDKVYLILKKMRFGG